VNDMFDQRKTPGGTGPPGADTPNNAPNNGSPTLRPMLWYWLLAIVLFMVFQTVTDFVSSSPLAYSEFKQLLHGGKVSEVTVAETNVSGTLKSGGLDAILPMGCVRSMPLA
jgi:cell division protease FtsH